MNQDDENRNAGEVTRRHSDALGSIIRRDREWRDRMIAAIASDASSTIIVGQAIGLLFREGNEVEQELAKNIQRMVEAFAAEGRARADAIRRRNGLLS